MKYRSIQFYFLQEIRLFDRVNYLQGIVNWGRVYGSSEKNSVEGLDKAVS